MSERKADTIQVNVLDEPFRIRSEADDEYTRQVASHVDGALRAVRRGSPALEPFQTAVLGAMGISDELFRARADLQRFEGLSERLEQLRELVDSALDEQAELVEALGGEVEAR